LGFDTNFSFAAPTEVHTAIVKIGICFPFDAL